VVRFLDEVESEGSLSITDGGRLPSLAKDLSKFRKDSSDHTGDSFQSGPSSRSESFEHADLVGTFPVVKKKKPKLRKAGSNEFKGLVALINHSKKNKGGNNSVDGVLKRWTVISKY